MSNILNENVNYNNNTVTELNPDNLKSFIDSIIDGSSFRRYKEEKRKRINKSFDFYNWLKDSCNDEIIVSIGAGIIGVPILPPSMYEKIKPWIDRYEKEIK